MYHFAGYFCKIILSIFGRLKVYQKEKLPQKDGYVIACTHTGWVDILWLGVSILPLKIHYMAKIELFKKQPVKWLMQKLNAFPVDRENPGPSSFKILLRLISEGEMVGIFSSGTRTSEEVLLMREADTIDGRSNAPIVLAADVGPNNCKDIIKFHNPRLIFDDLIHATKNVSRKEDLNIMMVELDEAMHKLHAELERKGK